MLNEKSISDFMKNSPNSLQEFSDFINHLIKEHGRDKIINTAGIDKNVLYRASNSQNIGLKNYYKIKEAYNKQLKENNNREFIEDLPILGQVIDNTKVRSLNPSQPISVPVPSVFIEHWSPVFGYLCVSSTAYSGFVYIFSGKNLSNTKSINKSCSNRLIMAYPEDEDPIYCMCLKHDNHFDLVHPRSRQLIKKVDKVNNINWVKFTCLIPYSLMENHEQPQYQDNIHKLEENFYNKNPIKHE